MKYYHASALQTTLPVALRASDVDVDVNVDSMVAGVDVGVDVNT